MVLGLLLAVLLIFAWLARSQHPAAALDGEEARLLDLINEYRAANGLGALSLNDPLNSSARWMAEDMARNDYLSHTDSLGRDPVSRMAAFGYGYNTWKGENLAAGMATAQEAFDHWRQSPSHNANLLNPNFTVIGIGRAYNPGTTFGWYWANDFGGQGAQPPPPPAPAAVAPMPPPAPAPEVPSEAHPTPEPPPPPAAIVPDPEPTPAPSPSPAPATLAEAVASAAPALRWWHIAGSLEPLWERLTLVGAGKPILRTASFLAGWYLERETFGPSQGAVGPPALATLRLLRLA